MLSIVVAKEQENVEQKRNDLIVETAGFRGELQEIEDRILFDLEGVDGNVLDDEELINTLASSSGTAAEIESNLKTQEQTRLEIEEVRDSYKDFAKRAASFFFVASWKNFCFLGINADLEQVLCEFLRTLAKFWRKMVL